MRFPHIHPMPIGWVLFGGLALWVLVAALLKWG